MYGLWLFKELKTEYGYCKVDIYRKSFTGSAIEIGGFVGDSLSIALENLDTITAPVGKSVCSFAIYDTEQVEYDDLFSPDATAFKVVVSTRVWGGAYATRWSGYVTPDFFAENLSYRTPISISARDNIGYLNDVDFDLTATTITVRELIQSAFRKIAEDYPMSLSFVSQKQTAEGILAIDATISTTLLREMSWGEALETILHDLGLQMRWVDNNTIAVLDLSQIPEYYATQGFNFIDASGYREIAPAWRELSQEQDFGLKENFFEGWLREDNITFVKSVVMRPPNATNWTTDIAYYVPNNWGVARDIYTTDPSYYGSKFGKKIFFTGVSEQNPTTTYFSWRQQIQSSIVPMKMSFKAFNSVLYPSEKYASLTTPSGRRLVAYNPKDAFHGQKVGEYLQIGLKANVLLHSGLKTYILKSEWVEISDDGAGWQLDFTLPKVELSYIEGNQATAVEPREEEITINIATIPYDGELEFRIYGWYIVGKHNYWEDDYSVTNYTFDWLKCLAYINEPTFSFNTDEADSGRETNVMIAEAHNIKQEESYIFGQTFSNGGGLNAYAGALVGTDGNELAGFQRNANATNYNLLELVGRELIHFNKKNYNRLSGTIKNLNKEPLMFNRLFVREGKKYAPYNYSLNIISNEMNITSMQEVEQYETATFNTIDSQITTGGGTVSGGNNTILQYSEEAGNEKRLYELQTATEQEKNDAYVLVDKAGFPEARKVHISELGGFDVSELEQYLESNGYATLKRIWEVDSANAVVRTTYNVVSTQEVISGRRASGASSDVSGGGGISQVTAQMIVDALGYVPYSSQNPSGYITSSALNGYAKTSDIPSLSGYATETWVTNKGYITSAALNGYATQAWVEAKKYLTAIPSEYVTETELSSTLGGYQTKITSSNKLAYSLISGTPTLATVATSGKYSDLSGVPTSLPASDVYAWAKAATKPSYTASEVGALSTGGGTITGLTTIKRDAVTPLEIENTATTNTLGQTVLRYKYGGSYVSALGAKTDGYLYRYNSYLSSSYKLLDSGNYSSYALPLSGGILSDSWSGGTEIRRKDSNNGYASLIFSQSDGAILGRFGFGGVDNPLFITQAGGYNTLIHSGNIGSQSVANADTLDGFHANSLAFYSGDITTLGGNPFLGYAYPTNGWVTYGPAMTFGSGQYYLQFQYIYNAAEEPYIRTHCPENGYSSWQQLAYLTSNVASATKLQTARTIWGQSFDGTGDVTGAASFANGRVNVPINGDRITFNGSGYSMGILAMNNGNTYIEAPLASDSSSAAQTPILIGWRNGVYPFYIGPSGNVLIGTTSDSGSGAKLQVNGNITATGEVISTRRATSSDARLKDNINRLLAEDCLAMVRNLHPSSWDWKENGEHSMGFIAQDVEPLMPYAVTRIKDDKLGEKLNLQYDQFFAPVVGAIQCLDSEVEQLKKRVKYLENKLQEYGYNRY